MPRFFAVIAAEMFERSSDVFALHPFMYNGINASNYDDSLEVLKKKFEQTVEYGVRQIAVLADDAGVPGGNNEAGWDVYTRLMKDLTDWVSSEEMQEKYEGLKVVIPFCPNDYMGNGNSAQLKYLGQNMPETVPLVVTGGKVWGEVSPSFTQGFKDGVGRGPYMWINWPCTDNTRDHLSMGGYGAVFHALSAPGKYAACGSFSGAIEKVDLTQCIGSAEKYDILSLLKRRVGEGAKLPLFYLSCGENDFIYDNSVRLEQAMTNLGVAHRWESVEGFAHEWRFWDMQLERFIKWLPRTDYYKGKVRNV